MNMPASQEKTGQNVYVMRFLKTQFCSLVQTQQTTFWIYTSESLLCFPPLRVSWQTTISYYIRSSQMWFVLALKITVAS